MDPNVEPRPAEPAGPASSHLLPTGLKLPLLITLGLRLGLSLWIGLIWALVDRFHPVDSTLTRMAYGVLDVPHSLLGRAVLHAWVRWDAVHFLNIAQVGYANLGLGDYNFFPLYPTLIQMLSLYGLANQTLVALAISTTAAFLALVLFRQLALAVFNDEQLAGWTILLWAIFPTGFFLFAPYSDALFSTFALGCLLALKKQRWLGAGLLAALAGLTRGQGLLLVVPMGVQLASELYQTRKFNLQAFVGTLLAPLGGLAYLLWRTQRAGMLFAGYAEHSRRSLVDPLTAFFHAIQQALAFENWQSSADILAILFFGALILYLFKIPALRKELALIAYTLVTFASFLPWYSEVVPSYQSSTRYVLSLHPAFLALAYILVKQYPRLRKPYVLASLSLLLLASAAYALWVFVG